MNVELMLEHHKAEIKNEVLTAQRKIKDFIEPKIRDALLYVDRETPNKKQVIRLLEEIRAGLDLL